MSTKLGRNNFFEFGNMPKIFVKDLLSLWLTELDVAKIEIALKKIQLVEWLYKNITYKNMYLCNESKLNWSIKKELKYISLILDGYLPNNELKFDIRSLKIYSNYNNSNYIDSMYLNKIFNANLNLTYFECEKEISINSKGLNLKNLRELVLNQSINYTKIVNCIYDSGNKCLEILTNRSEISAIIAIQSINLFPSLTSVNFQIEHSIIGFKVIDLLLFNFPHIKHIYLNESIEPYTIKYFKDSPNQNIITLCINTCDIDIIFAFQKLEKFKIKIVNENIIKDIIKTIVKLNRDFMILIDHSIHEDEIFSVLQHSGFSIGEIEEDCIQLIYKSSSE